MLRTVVIALSFSLSYSLSAAQTQIISSYPKEQLEETVLAMGQGAALTSNQYAIALSTFLPSLEQDLKSGKIKGYLLHSTKKIIDSAAQVRPKTLVAPAAFAYFLKLQELQLLINGLTTPSLPKLSASSICKFIVPLALIPLGIATTVYCWQLLQG